jgi:hypothetical protein
MAQAACLPVPIARMTVAEPPMMPPPHRRLRGVLPAVPLSRHGWFLDDPGAPLPGTSSRTACACQKKESPRFPFLYTFFIKNGADFLFASGEYFFVYLPSAAGKNSNILPVVPVRLSQVYMDAMPEGNYRHALRNFKAEKQDMSS